MKTARLATKIILPALALGLIVNIRSGAQQPRTGHPYPQPTPSQSIRTPPVGDATIIKIDTGKSIFPQPEKDPFTQPPGTNFLPTIYTNMFDGSGAEMLNTLPSTPDVPYNLHDGAPVVSKINALSPTDDLRSVFVQIARLTAKEQKEAVEEEAIRIALQRGLDILEGNPINDRAYSGLPLLHYAGPEKVKPVVPIRNAQGQVIGGNVDVHQVWFDANIESDTAFIDPSALLPPNNVPPNVTWTVTYTVDVLSRGEDDFSPFVMYVDPTQASGGMPPPPHVAMDQTFFPMENGTRTVFKIKMARAKYFNLIYTWGWRMHPPRAQVMENALKKASIAGQSHFLPDWERSVFCRSWQPTTPDKTPCQVRNSEENKLFAIGKIGDFAPAKRMWNALRDGLEAAKRRNYRAVTASLGQARAAFDDWRDRTSLPGGVNADPQADLTLLYANNTIYAEFSDRSKNNNLADSIRIDWPEWKLRGVTLHLTLYNGDNFPHAYQNVDFGGARGWENQFKSSVKVGGSGCWFTFGRAHWWMNVPPVGSDLGVVVPAASGNQPSKQRVDLTYNYEPSRRLRFYQFDPVHHDVAILSVH